MNDSIVRYKLNPTLTDTVGFYDYCIPLTNESHQPVADSLRKYYDFSIYNYVTPPPPARQLQQTISVFRPHLLEPKQGRSSVIEHQSTDWITIVFLSCLFIFAWIQTYYSKRLGQIFRAVAQPHHINQLEREGNLFKERISLGLGFIYYTISTIFIFLIFRYFEAVPYGLSNMAFAGIILGSLFLYQMLKSAVVYASGVIFDTPESSRKYQLNILIFNHVIGIFLFPVVIAALYWNSEIMLLSGSILIILLIAYRTFRGILTGISNKSYNLFYLFLYLCTLEILPLLLIYKVISMIES
jgi:hypothetical protein